MALQRITVKLHELRCLSQSESGSGSEPYLWTTFFAFGGERLPFQTGNLAMITPAYDAFRSEFPNGMKAGSVATVPTFVASAHFDIDLDTVPRPKLVGCIAVLMEEDSTRQGDIVRGRIAYSKEIEAQLDALVSKRIQTGNFGPLTDAEIETIKSNVKSKVEDAVGSQQSIFDIFRDQDDNIGFTHAVFKHPAGPGDLPISAQAFTCPEIVNGSDRFVLSGTIGVGAVPAQPVVLCASQRAAIKAKEDEIKGLQLRRLSLQQQLQTAPPSFKAALVDLIQETGEAIARAESELPALQDALEACLPNTPDVDVDHDLEPISG
jgi:hypothetical protein